ncbi:hypothetical protein ACH4E8_34220 [Streptomyces sp. NPDC017979]|uniref:hypothetical protein n=1 Tax=Streptomyces sp. NPDC017979 TaxID=3365024 RepID=UPI0037930973
MADRVVRRKHHAVRAVPGDHGESQQRLARGEASEGGLEVQVEAEIRRGRRIGQVQLERPVGGVDPRAQDRLPCGEPGQHRAGRVEVQRPTDRAGQGDLLAEHG